MKLINSRNKWDCGVACLAMLLDSNYEQALRLLGRDPSYEYSKEVNVYLDLGETRRIGVLQEEVERILFEAGISFYSFIPKELKEEKYFNLSSIRVGSLDTVTSWMEHGGKGMLGVVGKNYGHYVCFEGYQIFDPSKPAPSYMSERLEICFAILRR